MSVIPAPGNVRSVSAVPGPGAAVPDPLSHKRRMVADLCRFMGAQLTGRSGSGDKAADRLAEAAAGLAPRVRQTLARLLAGDSEKQVAANFGVSPHTVHVYVKTLYRHFNVSSRGELVARLLETMPPG